MEHMLYWLWLTTKFKGANVKISSIVEHFGSIENVYEAKSFEGIDLSEEDKSQLLDKDLSAAGRIAEKMEKLGGKVIAIDDENYPQLLSKIHNPPSVLYIKGKVPSLDDVLTIGIVGTRITSEYGRVMTKRLSGDLAANGVVTVSGMAMGIDAIGAWATIEEGGIAVGVIASGIDIAYPRENAELYKAIAEKGCIMTEFPPGTAPIPRHFPVRNRIIAGLSRGVLVTEAPEKSGALITARLAVEEGRDVFAVPRGIGDTAFAGTNRLIQQGAKLVLNAEDILCEYPYAKRMEHAKEQHETPPKDNSDKLKNLSDREKAVTDLLAKGDMQIDEIARALGAAAGEINTRLLMLEVKGIVKKLPGSMYQLRI